MDQMGSAWIMLEPLKKFFPYLLLLPYFIIWSIGIIFSIVWWRKKPKNFSLFLIACAGFLIITPLGVLIPTWLIENAVSQGFSAQTVGGWISLVNLVKSFISAILWILILGAVFRNLDGYRL